MPWFPFIRDYTALRRLRHNVIRPILVASSYREEGEGASVFSLAPGAF